MSTPFLGEIRITSFEFAPRGWAFCNGQILPINQNQALFSLLGTNFGGNGTNTFALPNLQARVPMHTGSGPGGSYYVGQSGGEATHTLTVPEIASHTHSLHTSTDPGDRTTPALGVPAAKSPTGADMYTAAGAPLTSLDPNAVGATGANQPHANVQPCLTLNFVIALQGIFPSRN